MIYIVLLLVAFLIFRKVTEPKVSHIDQATLEIYLKDKKKYQFIDVRTPNEFNSHKVKGFKNMPLQTLNKHLDKLSKDQAIVLLCATGSRSMNAARVLKKAGYDNLINVKGGLSRMT